MHHPSVGVYLGANMVNHPAFQDAVIRLGKGLAELGLTLIYGGGNEGLMGALATTVKQHGGRVVAIITEHLVNMEGTFTDADELHIVHSMYERKKLIHDKSSRFLIMPGGIGTFDELFETWCAIKNGVMQKPIGFVNIEGFFDGLFQFVNTSKHHGFLDASHQDIPTIYDGITSCLKDLAVKTDVHASTTTV